MKIWAIRTVLTACFVVAVPCSFFATLFREIKSSFWFAWNSVEQEYESFLRLWNDPLNVSAICRGKDNV